MNRRSDAPFLRIIQPTGRHYGATLNPLQSSAGHDAAVYGSVPLRVRISRPALRHKSGIGQLVPV